MELDGPLGLNAVMSEDSCLVRVTGELDIATEPELVERVRELIVSERPQRISIDTSGVTFIDSSGLRGLLLCRQAAQESNIQLFLVPGQGSVSRLLRIAGVESWFDYA